MATLSPVAHVTGQKLLVSAASEGLPLLLGWQQADRATSGPDWRVGSVAKLLWTHGGATSDGTRQAAAHRPDREPDMLVGRLSSSEQSAASRARVNTSQSAINDRASRLNPASALIASAISAPTRAAKTRSRSCSLGSLDNPADRRSRKMRAAQVLLVCTVAALQVARLRAFPSGAPDSACKDLKPGHGVETQTGATPFELTQDKLQAAAGDQIKVTLSSASKETFKGLIVQALDEKGEPAGRFLSGKGLKTLDSCAAVTHADREPKKTATLVWEAPAGLTGKGAFAFRATVVHKFEQFYMNVKSTLAS